MTALKKEIKAHAEGVKVHTEEIKAQAEEIKAQDKTIKVLKRNQMIQIRTITSHATEITALRDKYILQELKITEQIKKFEKSCVKHIEKILSVAWPTGVQLLVFFCSSVPVVLFDTPGISRCRSQHVSVESSSLLHHSIYL